MGVDRKQMISQLSSPDEEIRRQAMVSLKGSLVEEDLSWATGPLSDQSWRVRKEAIEGISRLAPSQRLVAHLVGLLDPSHEVILRNSVTEILEKMGREAVPHLLTHLSVDQPDVRKFLVDILSNIADPSTMPDLIRLLGDPVDNVRASAAEALSKIGDRTAVRALLDALEGADDWSAYSILTALGKMKAPEALPLFFRNLGKGILSIPCIQGIGAMGSVSEGLLLVEKILTMPRGQAKMAFLAAGCIYRRGVETGGIAAARPLREALAAIADPSITDFLISQLAVTDVLEMKRDIISTLGMIGGPAALSALLVHISEEEVEDDLSKALHTMAADDGKVLETLLLNPDDLVRRKALEVMAQLGDRRFLPLAYPHLRDENGHARQLALRAVARLGTADDLDRLLDLLQDGYLDVREAAAEALVTLGKRVPRELVARVETVRGKAPPATRALLLRILGEVDASRHTPSFLQALSDPEPEVRASGIVGLRHSRDPQAVSAILTALADENPEVRVEAAVALGDLAPVGAIPALQSAAYDQDPSVRAAAITALGTQPGLSLDDLERLLEQEDVLSKTAVIGVLGRHGAQGEEKVIDLLEGSFRRESMEIRCEICRVMGPIPGLRSLNFLLLSSRAEEGRLRMFTVYALSSRPEVEAQTRLTEMASSDPDRTVREIARSLVRS